MAGVERAEPYYMLSYTASPSSGDPHADNTVRHGAPREHYYTADPGNGSVPGRDAGHSDPSTERQRPAPMRYHNAAPPRPETGNRHDIDVDTVRPDEPWNALFIWEWNIPLKLKPQCLLRAHTLHPAPNLNLTFFVTLQLNWPFTGSARRGAPVLDVSRLLTRHVTHGLRPTPKWNSCPLNATRARNGILTQLNCWRPSILLAWLTNLCRVQPVLITNLKHPLVTRSHPKLKRQPSGNAGRAMDGPNTTNDTPILFPMFKSHLGHTLQFW